MRYVQLTLNDWLEMKESLKRDIQDTQEKWNGIKKNFVRIGYKLRVIEEQKLYERDGYKSLAEFAKAECGLTASDVTRSIQINKRYSIDGFSEEIRPEFLEYGNGKLVAMLALPDEDLEMVQPEASRESIRELSRFNKAEPTGGVANDIRQLVENFFKDNPEILNRVFSEMDTGSQEENTKRLAEIINPGGNRSYKKGLYFLMMYEGKVVIKKFGGTPQDMPWEDFIQTAVEIFGEAAAGGRTWENYFGGNEQGAGTGEKEREEETGEEKIAPAQKTAEILEEAASAPEEKQTEKDTENGEKGEKKPETGNQEGENEAAGRKTEEKKPEKETRTVQKTAEILEEEGKEEGEAKETEGDGGKEETEPGSAEPEVIEPFGSRIEYLDALTTFSAARYMAMAMKEIPEEKRKVESVIFWERWLGQEVDREGREIEQAPAFTG